jgi:hypothetical protein
MGETLSMAAAGCCAGARNDTGRRTKELLTSRDRNTMHQERMDQFKRATKLHLDAVFGNGPSDREVYRDFANRHKRTSSAQEVDSALP